MGGVVVLPVLGALAVVTLRGGGGGEEVAVKLTEILLMGATGLGLLLCRQQNIPTLQVNPTYLASGTGTSQCWSGLAQPQDLGSTVFIRFLILWTLIPGGNLKVVKSSPRAGERRRSQGNVLMIIAGWLVGNCTHY